MIREIVRALVASLLTFALCALIYPATVWVFGRLTFPQEASGSLVRNAQQEVVGSRLIAQPFVSASYFHPRPSAVDYNASAAGGSNLASTNPDLAHKVAERAQGLAASPDAPAPLDLVTASGSGLDPHISPEAARFQANRVAEARNLPIERVRELIEKNTDHSGAILGAPARVNVLLLNIELDNERPVPRQAIVLGR